MIVHHAETNHDSLRTGSVVVRTYLAEETWLASGRTDVCPVEAEF